MKSVEQIKSMIQAGIEVIEADSRYQSGLESPATVFANAPLALIQCRFEGEIGIFKELLKYIDEPD